MKIIRYILDVALLTALMATLFAVFWLLGA